VNVHLNRIPNKPAIFGNQYIVDEQENILEEETWLLVASLTRGIGEVEKEIHSLGGICIPAHINRLHYGLYSQIGFLPEDLTVDALEISMTGDPEAFMKEHPEIKRHTLIASSDAHSLDKIGTRITEFFMEDRDLGEISQALQQINGRRTKYK
jgi:PHP family Zn ribbon phosphoesterase